MSVNPKYLRENRPLDRSFILEKLEDIRFTMRMISNSFMVNSIEETYNELLEIKKYYRARLFQDNLSTNIYKTVRELCIYYKNTLYVYRNNDEVTFDMFKFSNNVTWLTTEISNSIKGNRFESYHDFLTEDYSVDEKVSELVIFAREFVQIRDIEITKGEELVYQINAFEHEYVTTKEGKFLGSLEDMKKHRLIIVDTI